MVDARVHERGVEGTGASRGGRESPAPSSPRRAHESGITCCKMGRGGGPPPPPPDEMVLPKTEIPPQRLFPHRGVGLREAPRRGGAAAFGVPFPVAFHPAPAVPPAGGGPVRRASPAPAAGSA